MSLSQFQPIIVSFAAISAVLCRCFKAMSPVRILASNRASFNTCPVHNYMSVKLTAALRNVLIHSSAPSFVSART